MSWKIYEILVIFVICNFLILIIQGYIVCRRNAQFYKYKAIKYVFILFGVVYTKEY